MRWTIAGMSALLLLAGSAVPVLANAAPPPVPKDIQFGAREAKIVVEVDERAKQARLIVPAQLIAPAKKGAPQPGAGAGLPMVMVGLALTAAFVTGGFWLIRKGPSRPFLLALFLPALTAFALLSGRASADLPREPATKPIKLPANVKLSSDKIMLEIVPFGDSIKLIVPKDAVAEMKPEEKKPE